jgi:3-deoxy-7-phosphoheptulonate synthase
MSPQTSDLRISAFDPLLAPSVLRDRLPLTTAGEGAVSASRQEIEAILTGQDDRLMVVVGPCSVHDPVAALEYARRLKPLADKHSQDLLIVMRVYFEKPRSTGGWKGLINDPRLDGTHDVAEGLAIARALLLDIVELGLPVGCEFLEPTSPHYIADTISWGAIGARTTESQIHRQLASGMSMPIGFKNATDGDVQVAVDGVTVAGQSQVFFGIDDDGRACVVSTAGNEFGHVILRGGKAGPNYSSESLAAAVALVEKAGMPARAVVDASHANSGKDHVRQMTVARELAGQVAAGDPISGIMLESFLVPGRQNLTDAGLPGLVFGQSITDACMGWDDTVGVLEELAHGARHRARRLAPAHP